MILINNPLVFQTVSKLPLSLIPLLPYYLDVLRLFGPANPDYMADEIMDNRMHAYVHDSPSIIYPLVGIDPWLRKQEVELYYKMTGSRSSDLYNDVLTFCEAMDNIDLFTRDTIAEINNVIGNTPCMIQFTSNISFLISRRF